MKANQDARFFRRQIQAPQGARLGRAANEAPAAHAIAERHACVVRVHHIDPWVAAAVGASFTACDAYRANGCACADGTQYGARPIRGSGAARC